MDWHEMLRSGIGIVTSKCDIPRPRLNGVSKLRTPIHILADAAANGSHSAKQLLEIILKK